MIAKPPGNNPGARCFVAYTKGIAMLTLKIITAVAGFGAVGWMLITPTGLELTYTLIVGLTA